MSNKIKVIFLDVDGVLNSRNTTRRTAGGYTFIGSRQVSRLRHIVRQTGAKVVLSSDWRYDRDDPKGQFDGLNWVLQRNIPATVTKGGL